MEGDPVQADITENKTELEFNNEIVSDQVLDKNETDIKPKKVKMKKQKSLSEENVNGENSECQKPSPKKKRKKTGSKINKLEGCISNDVEEEDLSEVVEPPKQEEPAGAGFTILEELKANKNDKVFRVLPTWLAKPSVISCDLSKNKMPITEISGIDKFLLDALKRNKIEYFFPGNYFCFTVC
jgi:hypothetical protein